MLAANAPPSASWPSPGNCPAGAGVWQSGRTDTPSTPPRAPLAGASARGPCSARNDPRNSYVQPAPCGPTPALDKRYVPDAQPVMQYSTRAYQADRESTGDFADSVCGRILGGIAAQVINWLSPGAARRSAGTSRPSVLRGRRLSGAATVRTSQRCTGPAEHTCGVGSTLLLAREGDRRCRLPPDQRAIVALMYLRVPTLTKTAAGFGISEGAAHPTSAVPPVVP